MSTAASSDLRTGWQVSREAQPDHVLWAEGGGRLFATAGWARVLSTLGAEPAFAWHPHRGIGAVVPVFRRFGLRIGFLGLPAAGAEFDAMDGPELAACTIGIASAGRLDLVRTTQAMRPRFDPRATGARPEVWIDDLGHWKASDRKRLRKDLAFARRTAPAVELVETGFDPGACYELYASTVSRHRGTERYGRDYFVALGALAAQSPRLGFFAAMAGSMVKGFAVVALHGGLANYLHGAVNAEGRREGLSDLLLEQLLGYARNAGATRFTFMSSPWSQPGLLQFKQKWGDTTGLSVTYDRGFGALGRCAVLASKWQWRDDRRMAALADAKRESPGGGP